MSRAEKSIAVLPFVNMSADKTDEYLSDGMTEELINALARVPDGGFRDGHLVSLSKANPKRMFSGKSVISCMSIQSWKEAFVKPAKTAGHGPTRSTVADGYDLLSKDYDGDVRDIFTFQSNVAQRVVEALQIKLGVEAARALAKKPTENPEAHRLYLLGRYELANTAKPAGRARSATTSRR